VTAAETPPVLSALACGVSHDLDDSALCRVVGPHDNHDYDGLGDWAADYEETPDA
jgi:hypothetical protein